MIFMLDFKITLLLKIMSALFFLLSGFIWKRILMDGGRNYHFIFYRVVFTLFFFGLLTLYYEDDCVVGFSIFKLPFVDWITCLIVCLCSFWGLYFYTEALQKGRFSFITPLIVISSAFSFLTSLLLYNEALSMSKYVALFLILAGLLFHQKEKLVAFQLSKEVLLILLFSVFWGVSFVFYLIPIKKFGVLNFSILLEICVFISCMGLLIFKEKRIIPPKLDAKNIYYCLLMGFLVAFGSLLSNFTLTQLHVSLNILIGLFFELLVLVIGLYFFREKLNAKDWILIIFATIGGFLMLF